MDNKSLFINYFQIIIKVFIVLFYYKIKIFTNLLILLIFQWIQELVHLNHYNLILYFYLNNNNKKYY